MTTGLEDKIIAYFDGELSDADSAELLHLTSVSPEIRDLFRQHEMLRDLAHEATRSVMVNPEVESSLFSRIEALSEGPIREKAVLVFSRRTAVLAALALVLISGSLGYFIPRLISESTPGSAQNISPRRGDISGTIPFSHSAPAEPKENILKSEISDNNIDVSSSFHAAGISEAPHRESSIRTGADLSRESDGAHKTDIAESSAFDNRSQSVITPVNFHEEDIHSDIGTERHSPFDRKEMPTESRSLFEASLQTSSGFTYPADASPIKPFADQRLSFAYHITENNLIGFRLGSGLYQQLGDVKRSSDNGTELLTRSIETKRSFSEELYVSHLEPIFVLAPFTLEFSLGGGFRIPFAENVMFDVAFALSRIHSNAQTSSAILDSENSSGKPVMIDAADIHNTLNGRLHYGLLFRF
jgi:hypothetical protein